jgi:hypothetical protein
MNINYNLDQEPIVVSKPLIDKLLKTNNFSELLSLYTFYYYTAKWQKTNQPHANIGYVAKGLHWGVDKVRKYKKQLKSLGLIDDVQRKDKNNRFTTPYIKVNFMWAESTIIKKISHPIDFSEGGDFPTLEKSETNALNTDNRNALSTNKEILFDQFWALYDYRKGKEKSKKVFLKLPLKTIEIILKKVPEYVKSTPDKKYRKHPLTYLSSKAWEDEVTGEPDGSNREKAKNRNKRRNSGANIQTASSQKFQYTGA